MKGKTVGLLIGGAGLLYWFSTRIVNLKQAISKLTASNPRIKISLRGLAILLDVTLDIVNPGSIDIPFEYYAGTMLYNNNTIGTFNYNYQGKAVTLKARSATPLNFTISISSIPTLLQLTKVVQALYNNSKTVSTLIQVRSAIYAGGFDVPVNFLYDLKTQAVISGVGIIAGRKKEPLPLVEEIEVEPAMEGIGQHDFVI